MARTITQPFAENGFASLRSASAELRERYARLIVMNDAAQCGKEFVVQRNNLYRPRHSQFLHT